MNLRQRLVPSPAGVDWGLLAAVAAAVATGVYGLVAGRPGQGWVFVVHGAAGLAFVALLAAKLVRVADRLRPAKLTRARAFSAALGAAALAALVTGTAWSLGVGTGIEIPFWTLLNVHMWLGALAAVLLVGHLTYRRRPVRTARAAGRRDALRYLGLVVAGGVGWRLQQAGAAWLELPGDERRFTGSREEGSDAGNRFPVTSWVLDDPDPVGAESWSLSVDGRVERELAFDYGELVAEAGEESGPGAGADESAGHAAGPPPDDERAVLDCTSGWYSEHDWRGIRVGDLLAAAGVGSDARWVQFRSVTGYRWSLPVEEAREALLATHVDGEPLSHGHGAPARLVAPGRRGFQWVKWVERASVRRSRDVSEVVAIHLSGFDGEG